MKASLPPPAPPDVKTESACRAYYESMDLNKNGVPDWTSQVEGRTSNVLYPADIDMDGDGVENVFDPDPLDPFTPGSSAKVSGLPFHLKMDGTRGLIQAKLHKEFGIIAIDHTDKHAESTLEVLLLLLREGLTQKVRARLSSVKYVYAFLLHDPHVNIAAYHRQMNAISIGGEKSYGTGPLDQTRKVAVLSSFAHEFGHAFIFDTMSPPELHSVGAQYGKWEAPPETETASSLFDRSFFRNHPFRKKARLKTKEEVAKKEFVSREVWRESSLVSEYATKNLHEWFADSFAAGIIHRLGEAGHLGETWRDHLVRFPRHPNGYWVNYNNLSPGFRTWLDTRLEERNQPDSMKSIGK
jgi:hypothetical protein